MATTTETFTQDRSSEGSAPRNSQRSIPFLTREELADTVIAYQEDADYDRLLRGYDFAREKHGEVIRQSGDPYYSHPVRVATLLASVKLDEATILAGLLHDTVEDCDDVSLADIERLFGADVAELVDGVTKLGRLEYKSEESKQAENFQKFILATVNDVRVLLVKLADRLHNMRTLRHMKKPESRVRKARETMDLYAPLARRVGLHYVASEMEDIAFEYLNPAAKSQILQQLEALESENATHLIALRTEIESVLKDEGIECRISGRRKEPYSIWRKLEKKSISFRQVADIFGFRVIVKTPIDCYRTLGIFHTRWACLPERFRDFISVPKANGYKSLHTTVRATSLLEPKNESGRLVELQIRTEGMDATAERGVAAHWTYKNSSYGFDAEASKAAGLDPAANLRAFADLITNSGDPNEFLEHAKMELYRTHVFAFTPKGRLVILPAGSMPLDFAYALHTAIGDTCEGVIINKVPRSLRTPLVNGDVVDIVRRADRRPIPGYEALTETGRARAAQRRLKRDLEAEDFAHLGREVFERRVRAIGVDPIDLDTTILCSRAKYDEIKELYEAIGRGQESVTRLLSLAFPEHPTSDDAEPRIVLDEDTLEGDFIAGDGLRPGVSLHLGTCCHPIPGDRILGVREPGRGIVVHTIYCGSIAKYDDEPDRWVDLSWTELAKSGVSAVARIAVNAADKKGVLAEQCSVVASAGGNIIGISTLNRAPGFMELAFDIEVDDLRHLEQIKAALRTLGVVESVERLEESGRDD